MAKSDFNIVKDVRAERIEILHENIHSHRANVAAPKQQRIQKLLKNHILLLFVLLSILAQKWNLPRFFGLFLITKKFGRIKTFSQDDRCLGDMTKHGIVLVKKVF